MQEGGDRKMKTLLGQVHKGGRWQDWTPGWNGAWGIVDERLVAILGMVHGGSRMGGWKFSLKWCRVMEDGRMGALLGIVHRELGGWGLPLHGAQGQRMGG